MIDIWKSIYLVNTFGIISNKKAKKPSTVCHMSSMWQLAKNMLIHFWTMLFMGSEGL